MGRPCLYTPEIVQAICDRLANGEPLEQICRSQDMPSSMTVYSWTRGEVAVVPASVAKDIARAKECGYDIIANRLREVAAGVPGASSGDVQRDKLIVDTDLKLLSKWHARKYGDSATLKDDKGDPLAAVNVTSKVLDALTPDQLEAIKALASPDNAS